MALIRTLEVIPRFVHTMGIEGSVLHALDLRRGRGALISTFYRHNNPFEVS